MDSVSKEEMEAALHAAVFQKDSRYKNYFALQFRWEDDNTDAERDGKNFSDLAKLLCFPEPEVLVIPKSHVAPGFLLTGKTIELLTQAMEATGRSVVMIHYAGHGIPNNLNELTLVSQTGKKISASRFLSDITTETNMPLNASVDIIVILDCCYSFLSLRQPNSESRIVEILTAGGKPDPIAFSPGARLSFTAKLLVNIRTRAQKGDKFVEIAEMMDTIKQASPVKKPCYAAKLGMGSITLPLSPISPAYVPVTRSPGLLATFSLHVSETFNKQELRNLVKWIQAMPKVKSATFKLENVKATNSMVFIFEASTLSFFRICGIPGLNLICENKNVDFAWLLRPQSSLPLPVRGDPLFPGEAGDIPSGQENIPLSEHAPSKKKDT